MKDAEKANELRHAFEGENQRLNAEVNEKIGDFEDVRERVEQAEGELAELEPKRVKAKNEIEEAKEQKHDVFEVAYALKNAMGNPKDYRPAGQIIADAKKWADEIEERDRAVAKREAMIERQTAEGRTQGTRDCKGGAGGRQAVV